MYFSEAEQATSLELTATSSASSGNMPGRYLKFKPRVRTKCGESPPTRYDAGPPKQNQLSNSKHLHTIINHVTM
eukprot:3457117-Amphidinium_carterae.1